MSDRDETTGQFTPVSDGLFGREAELADAGFKPMPESLNREPEEDDLANPREAADELNTKRAGAEPDEAITYFKVDTGEKAAANEAVTVERAAADLAAYRASKHDSAAVSISKDFAAEIDKLRGEAVNPEAPEPTEKPVRADEVTTEQPKPDKTDAAAADEAIDAMDGLDPETRKALKIPQVRQALEQQFGQADQIREQYAAGLETSRVTTLATLAEVVPHLAGLPPQQFEQGLAVLAEVDRPAFDKAMNILGRAHQIAQAQSQAQQQQAYHQHQQFESSVAAEDVRLTELCGGDKAKADEITNATLVYLTRHGVPRNQFMQVFKANPVLKTAEARQTIWEAEQYRAIQNAPKAVAHRDLPPVQRPGTAGPRVSSDQAAVSGLEAKFHRSGSAKDAAAALAARRKAAR